MTQPAVKGRYRRYCPGIIPPADIDEAWWLLFSDSHLWVLGGDRPRNALSETSGLVLAAQTAD